MPKYVSLASTVLVGGYSTWANDGLAIASTLTNASSFMGSSERPSEVG